MAGSSRSKNRFERHPGRYITLLLIVAFVMLLGVTEAFLRVTQDLHEAQPGLGALGPPRHVDLREWQPNLKFRSAPPDVRRANPGGPVHDVYALDTDAEGFIEPSRVHAKPDLTIAFLGGSTTECMYVTAEARFPYLVGRILEQRLGLKVNSLNGGRSGNNVMHDNVILTAKVLPLHADYVVLMSNINDTGVLLGYGSYWNASSDFAIVRRDKTGVERGFQLLRDALIPATYRAYRLARMRLARAAPAAPPPAKAVEPEAAAEHATWDRLGVQFKSAVRQFSTTAAAWDAKPVLMTEVLLPPGGWRRPEEAAGGDYLAEAKLGQHGLTSATFDDLHGYFNGLIRLEAQQSNVALVDLAAAGPWTNEHVYDGLHFTDAGSRRVAGLVADALEPMIRADMSAGRIASPAK
jgi:lysophospholipase L1-like esterase